VEANADLALITDIKYGDVVKVLSFTPSPGSRAFYYRYDSAFSGFSLVRIEAGTVALKDSIFLEPDTLATRSELRELIEALTTNVYLVNVPTGAIETFFGLVNFAFSEQSEIDWAFKTSYIYVEHGGVPLNKSSNVYRINPIDNIIEYMNEAKPYRTKIREITSKQSVLEDGFMIGSNDDAIGTFSDITNTWTLVSENLRFMDVTLNFNRVNCSVEGWCTHYTTIIDAYNLSLNGWDNQPYESIPWDSNNNDYQDTYANAEFPDQNPADSNAGALFGEYIGGPEELVLLSPNECVIITTRIDDQLSTKEIEYKTHLDGLGNVTYVRMSGVNNTPITTAIDKDTISISVTNASLLRDPTESQPGVIWVDDERIEYYVKVGNTLTDIRRGTGGTSRVDHASGAVAFDGSDFQTVPNGASIFWVDDVNGLSSSTTQQAQFLNQVPVVP
jgi:hypothetical protein